MLHREKACYACCRRTLSNATPQKVKINLSFPKKEHSKGWVSTLKFSWYSISGIHCLLLPRHYNISFKLYISSSLLSTSPRKTRDKLLHVILRTSDSVRSSEVSENGRLTLWFWQIRILQDQRPLPKIILWHYGT